MVREDGFRFVLVDVGLLLLCFVLSRTTMWIEEAK